VIIDPERWFSNEKGLDVGGVVLFAERNPRLTLQLKAAAGAVGFVFEPKQHGHGASADDAQEWSEMNHAFAGVCVLLLAVIGMLQIALPRPVWFVRYGSVIVWGALFFFLFVRSDRGAWPLGRIGWLESFQEWDTAQHRLGQGLILLVGVGDFLRLRRGWRANPLLTRWGMLALALAGSGMLFTHLHQTIDPVHYAMTVRMNVQHVGMAVSALLFGVSKFAWDTWQVPRRGGQYLWLVFLACMGLILTLYVE
jgi:hypothetical protein